MSRLLCCLRARDDMGAALSHPQEGDACDGVPAAPPTMADVIRERKKKAGGAGLGTLRRRIAAAARRPRDSRPDRGCEHARFIRSVVSTWRLAEVFLLCEELEAGAALRDLVTQAELAREPAAALHADLAAALRNRWWCDVEVGSASGGWSLAAHRAILAARSTYFRDLLHRHPGSCRVVLEGAGAALTRAELEAGVWVMYAGAAPPRPQQPCAHCAKWERGSTEANLDIIGADNNMLGASSGSLGRGCSCGAGGGPGAVGAAAFRRVSAALGLVRDALHSDMRYLLDSGEMCDARLSWRVEGEGYGFRSALELPCHRLLLAARSRFFRSVMSRRGSAVSGAAGSAVCVDEKVLPRRLARALLHAAYTDQVDLTLIGRSSSSPSSTNSTGSTCRSGRGSSTMLDDACQLYEIARFLEMPIVVQGCEDAIVEALSPETLPHVLRWASAPHASQWVHRQAMRYLRDEFPSIMASAASARLPRTALAEALASPFLQASEAQALRALMRWAERAQAEPPHCTEPNVVWHTGRGALGGRRRDPGGGGAAALAPLAPLVRTEHLPRGDLLHQAIRRGIIPSGPSEDACSADAWLGRGAARPPRCFLPYLDEIKALLEDQAVPEAEVARLRRARYLHRIPDTLYMVAAAREPAPEHDGGSSNACGVAAMVSGRAVGALRARVRELRASPPAARALRLHAADTRAVRRQIALRAVREMSLPDACAELLLAEPDRREEWEGGEGSSSEAGDGGDRGEGDDRGDMWRGDLPHPLLDCCRSSVSSGRCGSTGSLRSTAPQHLPPEGSRSSTCRRDGRDADLTHNRASSCGRARLSAAVPDVAMAPNANTHLLTARDYLYHPPPNHQHEYGAVLQLDLGDGATHTPRPGSRAQRASQHARQQREHPQSGGRSRPRPDDEELRAAIELSVIRAYSSLQAARRPPASHALAQELSVLRARATPSPSSVLSHSGASGASGASGPGGGGAGSARRPRRTDRHAHLSRVASSEPRVPLSASPLSAPLALPPAGLAPPPAPLAPLAPLRQGGSASPSPSPSPGRDLSLYRHDYRSGPGPGAGGPGGAGGTGGVGGARCSRGHSPSYA